MKRLLLFLLLSPFVLFAQTKPGQVPDSHNTEVTNLQSMTSAAGLNACARVADIRISNIITDSGEYLNTAIFFRKTTALDSAIFDTISYQEPAAMANMKTELAVIDKLAIIDNIPPLPLVKDEELTPISFASIMNMNIDTIQPDKLVLINNIPDLPIVKDDSIPPLLVYDLIKFNIDKPLPANMELVLDIPRLPIVKDDSIPALLYYGLVKFRIDKIQNGKLELVEDIPRLPFVKDEDLAPYQVQDLVKIKTDSTIISSLPIVTDMPPMPIIVDDTVWAIATTGIINIGIPEVPSVELVLLNNIPKVTEARTSVDEMHLSAEGYSLLEKMEGFSPTLYNLNDGGFTIGFGFFVPYNESYKWKKGVTWEEAEQLMEQKVPTYEDQVRKYINVPLTQSEFDALTMLAYNIGSFAKATSIVNDFNNQVSHEKLQADWKRFVHSKAPNVSKGLMNRRKDELNVKKIADYQPERKIQVLKK